MQLMRPAAFNSLVLCLGTFHTAKTLRKYTGKNLEGSGTENVWLEAGVYEPTLIQNYIFNGGYYSRSLDKLLAESMQRLLYKELFADKELQTTRMNYKC